MDSKWPSTVVAVALIVMIGGITIASILEYSADDALKFWGGLSGVVGVLTGAAATYFFTRGEVQKKEQELEKKDERLHETDQALERKDEKLHETDQALGQALQVVKEAEDVPETAVDQLREIPAVRDASIL